MDYTKKITLVINEFLIKINLLNLEQYKKDTKNWGL